MIIIPVPPSQRKPYHPVIMQVTKTPAVSSTERPQTKVVTYKLNKMFVPIGIYGKVLPKSEADKYQQQQSSEEKKSAHIFSAAPTPAPTPKPSLAIRHKGTSSEELITSGDSSSEFCKNREKYLYLQTCTCSMTMNANYYACSFCCSAFFRLDY